MCVDKAFYLFMATVIAIGTYLGFTGIIFGFYLLAFVVLMLVVRAATNFCPSHWLFSKFLKPC
ncbi:MAG: DUF2892 domain-containing protein [Leptonema sp. (in: Bacteria)]|nr:DUF2892 domain-containing protein [Leptonema sp. (in: bacteria)]